MSELRAEDAVDEYDTAQYVTFEMAGERYAFPMERVREIIRVPDLVRVPLGPPSLEGIANLRGRVLPVVNLRRCCGLPHADNDETTRVVVVDSLATVGLVVDRVTAVVSVEPSMVESGAAVQSTLHSDVLEAVVKTPVGMVTSLDIDRILRSQFRMLGAGAAGRDATLAPLVTPDLDEDDDGTDSVELVSFIIDNQEYALPIARVREIVQAPEAINRIPNASDRVLGVMDLRGKLLPILSMRRIFGLVETDLLPTHRIVVVALDGARTVGVVTDDVREVLRVPAELIAQLPSTMAAAGRSTEIESVCRLDNGARLVSVLNLDRLFADPGWDGDLDGCADGDAELVTYEDDDADGADDMDDDFERRDEELLVVFRLDGEQYAVDVDRVQ